MEKQKKVEATNKKQVSKTVNLHPTTSVITLEVNVSHIPIERQRLSEETRILKNQPCADCE